MKILWEKLYNDLADHVASALREARLRPEQVIVKTDGELLTIPGIKDTDIESIRTLYNKENLPAIKKIVLAASVEEEEETLVTNEAGEEEVVAAPKKARPAKVRSARIQRLSAMVNKDNTYLVKDAVELLVKMAKGSKAKTVELHINTRETGVRGEVKLPHATGKVVRIAIFSEALVTELNAGTLNFDILLATPADMPKLARYAKVLGPKGLMPNPKNGTVTPDPIKRQAELLAGGTLPYKTEAKFPIIHLNFGPITQSETDLVENINEAIRGIGVTKMKNAFLSCTHTPSIRINLSSFAS